MVRAILAKTKRQTRRVVKPQPYIDPQGNACWNGSNFGQDGRGPHIQSLASPIPSSKTGRVRCPYGQPGDRLWVREAWSHDAESLDQCRASAEDAMGGGAYGPYYRATEVAPDTLSWKPSIHMPRWASRITLLITSVRVERLQDISEADALTEGIVATRGGYGLPDGSHYHAADPRESYWSLWEAINGKGSVEAKPWVWAVAFKHIKGTP